MKKLVILSTGIIPGDITINTIEKANHCDLILNWSVGEAYLKRYIKKRIININEMLFKIEGEREKLNLLHNLLKKLFKRHSKIAIFVPGNPLFFNLFTSELYNLVKKEKIKVEVNPGISSLDYVINALSTKVNSELRLSSILSTPCLLLSKPKEFFNTDTIIMNFHIIKQKDAVNEKKRIIELMRSMKGRILYSIKINTSNSKEIIKKYTLPKDIEKFIEELDQETTIYLPGIKKGIINTEKEKR